MSRGRGASTLCSGGDRETSSECDARARRGGTEAKMRKFAPQKMLRGRRSLTNTNTRRYARFRVRTAVVGVVLVAEVATTKGRRVCRRNGFEQAKYCTMSRMSRGAVGMRQRFEQQQEGPSSPRFLVTAEVEPSTGLCSIFGHRLDKEYIPIGPSAVPRTSPAVCGPHEIFLSS